MAKRMASRAATGTQAMAKRNALTLHEAEALAESWANQKQHDDTNASLLSRFRTSSPAAVVHMWKVGVNEKGKRLSSFEVQALAERWCEVFGTLPPGDEASVDPSNSSEPAIPPTAPDSMLCMTEVCRLSGLSQSTIKRRVEAGTFPKPLKLGPRRIGWQAAAVMEWLERLEHCQ